MTKRKNPADLKLIRGRHPRRNFLIYMPEDTKERLRALAERNRRTMSAEVCFTIDEKYEKLIQRKGESCGNHNHRSTRGN